MGTSAFTSFGNRDRLDGSFLPPGLNGAKAVPSGLSRDPDKQLERKLELIVAARARRYDHFPADWFADPAWDLLLALALAELKQHRVSVSNLCETINAPASTAARWIKTLTDSGWLVKRHCPWDARIKYIELSAQASAKVRQFVEQATEIWASLAGVDTEEA